MVVGACRAMHHMQSASSVVDRWTVASLCLAVAAMLAKETGITVLGVGCSHTVWMFHSRTAARSQLALQRLSRLLVRALSPPPGLGLG
jgi:hypothetical protein